MDILEIVSEVEKDCLSLLHSLHAHLFSFSLSLTKFYSSLSFTLYAHFPLRLFPCVYPSSTSSFRNKNNILQMSIHLHLFSLFYEFVPRRFAIMKREWVVAFSGGKKSGCVSFRDSEPSSFSSRLWRISLRWKALGWFEKTVSSLVRKVWRDWLA